MMPQQAKECLLFRTAPASDYVAGGLGGQNNPYKTVKKSTIFDFYLNYNKIFQNINSRIDAVAGYSYNNYLTTTYNYARYYANGNKVPNSDPAFLFNEPEHTLISYFGRLNYTYMERYLLTATIRRDGSSRFGWIINGEPFLLLPSRGS